MIKFKECLRKNLSFITIEPQLLIYCVDTNDTFYYDSQSNRVVLNNFIVLQDDATMKSIVPESGVIYAIRSTGNIYRYDNIWKQVWTDDELLYNNYGNVYKPVTLSKDGDNFAPATLASEVYTNDGTDLQTVLADAAKMVYHKTEVTPVYVQAIQDNQKVFNIPYPFMNYNLTINHLLIMYKNDIINSNGKINGEYFILNDTIPKGDKLLFIFFYNVEVQSNDLLLETKNIDNGAITTEKLASTVTLPAEAIIQDDLNKMVSKNEIAYWDAKADKDPVTETTNGLMTTELVAEIKRLGLEVVKKPNYYKGSATFPTGQTQIKVMNDHITEDCYVVFHVDGSPLGSWKIDWFNGGFVINSDKTETADVAFKWMAFK